ncbi:MULTISPECIES: 30S ribosomal protein S16 [Thermocrispum]|mgnify:CR=1 FL=1|uniref:Small ribosomal subunit protein bS16 n=1 Tax=Thermocrispum agreste TaxID=37925 RepID=A0A2W4J484_9PSEU|nr:MULTISPECIES: 30S ribosomal protein S16 [Thermocrispum]PZM92998.1 MAG: 30S ribosomal protein S16 [Thermocrispum agreste]
MAVKIRLQRLGKIRNPYYRIVVADARTRRDGKAIETIGKYHPKQEPSFIEVDSERAQYWLKVGAQPTQPVQRILEITGDWQKFKGLPGAEGKLKVAPPKPSKEEIFAKALEEAGGRPEADATEGKKKSGKKDKAEGKKAKDGDKGKDEKKAKDAKSGKAEAKKADEAAEAKADAGEQAAAEGKAGQE